MASKATASSTNWSSREQSLPGSSFTCGAHLVNPLVRAPQWLRGPNVNSVFFTAHFLICDSIYSTWFSSTSCFCLFIGEGATLVSHLIKQDPHDWNALMIQISLQHSSADRSAMVCKQEISSMDFPKSFNSQQSVQQSKMGVGGKEKNYGKNTTNRNQVSQHFLRKVK